VHEVIFLRQNLVRLKDWLYRIVKLRKTIDAFLIVGGLLVGLTRVIGRIDQSEMTLLN